MKPTVFHLIVPTHESRQCPENCRYRSSSKSSCQTRASQTSLVDRSDEPGRRDHARTTTRLRRVRKRALMLLAVHATLSHNPRPRFRTPGLDALRVLAYSHHRIRRSASVRTPALLAKQDARREGPLSARFRLLNHRCVCEAFLL